MVHAKLTFKIQISGAATSCLQGTMGYFKNPLGKTFFVLFVNVIDILGSQSMWH